MATVSVIDDDDINRLGTVGVLREAADVIAAVTHREALAGGDDTWMHADVVVVDAADHRLERDQFPGVAVVERLRRARRLPRPRVVVVTAHYFNDAVRQRMREAGADLFYYRMELADAAAFRNAILRPFPDSGVPGAADPESALRHGVTSATRINRGVAFALDHALDVILTRHPLRRTRTLHHLRQRFNQEAWLTPMTTHGHRPDRHQDAPSVPQIIRFLAWATRVNIGPRRDDADQF